jgi:hypothetical protein
VACDLFLDGPSARGQRLRTPPIPLTPRGMLLTRQTLAPASESGKLIAQCR